MKDGFIKVAAVSPSLRVADCIYNTEQIIGHIENEYRQGSKIVVFPELCISAYTAGDLFLQSKLITESLSCLQKIVEASKDKSMLCFVGLPFAYKAKLYNVAAAFCDGKILALIPKTFLPNYNEFYEKRYFTAAGEENIRISLWGQDCIFGKKLLFSPYSYPQLRVAAELCEDLWAANPPSVSHALAGANVLVNLSASNELVAKKDYRRALVSMQSAKLYAAYIYACACAEESTGDLVFAGHNLIAENGSILAESPRFAQNVLRSEIDIQRLEALRQRDSGFAIQDGGYCCLDFALQVEETCLSRSIKAEPFVPKEKRRREERCEDILHMQARGLWKRLLHTGCKTAVIGVSGGLDSTLALIVTARAFGLAGLDQKGIKAVTMPAFGTTDRTYQNACKLSRALGADLEEINIAEAVRLHFRDIRHDIHVHNVTYENAQARERTQVLMDIANRENGLVVGTGDLSELALGWATYNGDHMSMYGLNASVPKTLIRYLVEYCAGLAEGELAAVLWDILDTPVSPELLPAKDGQISQKTEDLVGPYVLHDFFLYHMLRFSCSPSKIYRLAKLAFAGRYDKESIRKWLRVFYQRFFSQQFKRSCMPDGPKVGSISLSPRGDLRMPSDAAARIWLEELEQIYD